MSRVVFPGTRVPRAAWCLAIVLSCAGGTSTAFAQQTREEQITREQAEKSTRLHPYVPSKTEARVLRIEKALQTEPRGFYPWFGSVFPGGLLAVGPGYRMPFAGRAVFDAEVAASIKNYKLARATVTLPRLADRRVSLAFQTQFIDATKIGFYGVGPATPRSDRSTFLYRPANTGATITVTPMPLLKLGAGVSYLNIHTGPGRVGVSAEDRFSAAGVPGLGLDPAYVLSQASVAVDWRDSPGYSRRGGFYRVGLADYAQRQSGAFSFRRVDVDVQQLIPVLRANWVIALRGTTSLTYTDAGAQVPYFLMPALGGGSDLRGFATGRFRDQNRVLFTAEYCWTPAHLIDMAVFHDAGKVTSLRDEINVRGLTHTNGIGLRLHAPSSTFVRLEFARGREGNAIIVAFSQIF